MKTMVSPRALLLFVVFGSVHVVMGQMPSPRQQIIAKSENVTELAQNRSVQFSSGVGNPDPVTNNTLYSGDSSDGLADFTIAANPLAVQLTVGGTATSEISLSSSNGFSDSIQLACQNLPLNMFCTFTPPAVDLQQGGNASSQLIISTVQGKVIRSGQAVMALAMIPILGGMFFWRGVRTINKATVLVILASLMLFSGCQGLAPTSPSGQTFTIAVTGTALSGTSHSVQMKVTLQQ